jgi:hypothetical protein
MRARGAHLTSHISKSEGHKRNREDRRSDTAWTLASGIMRTARPSTATRFAKLPERPDRGPAHFRIFVAQPVHECGERRRVQPRAQLPELLGCGSAHLRIFVAHPSQIERSRVAAGSNLAHIPDRGALCIEIGCHDVEATSRLVFSGDCGQHGGRRHVSRSGLAGVLTEKTWS